MALNSSDAIIGQLMSQISSLTTTLTGFEHELKDMMGRLISIEAVDLKAQVDALQVRIRKLEDADMRQSGMKQLVGLIPIYLPVLIMLGGLAGFWAMSG